jgi:hypothetical protein
MVSDKKACKFCGEEILAVAVKCRHCGEYLDPSARPKPVHDAMERALLPVGRPASAIAAGYLALFGVLPIIGLPFSALALICGIVALKKIKADPTLSGSGRAWFGIVLGGLMTLVSFGFLVLLVIEAMANSAQR